MDCACLPVGRECGIKTEGSKQNAKVILNSEFRNGKEMSYLLCEELTKSFRHKKVVDTVRMVVRGGEVVGLLGPNGAGKTTIFYMIVGLLHPNGGRMYLNDEEITFLPMYLRARRGIGYLPQEPSVFRKLTVEENLMAILETLPLAKEERKNRLKDLL